MVGQSGTESVLDIVKGCCRVLDEQKAKDVVLLDIAARSGFADYFVIAGALSHGHLKGLLRSVDEFLASEGIHGRGSKRGPLEDENWLLIDCGNFIIHLMNDQAREFYALEKLWFESPQLDYKA